MKGSPEKLFLVKKFKPVVCNTNSATILAVPSTWRGMKIYFSLRQRDSIALVALCEFSPNGREPKSNIFHLISSWI